MLILLVIPLFGCLLLILLISILKKKWIISLILLLLIVILNLYAEIISFKGLFQSKSAGSILTVLTYNVHSSSRDYNEKQIAIAKEIISVSPDVAYLCEFLLQYNKDLDNILTENAYVRYYISGTNCVFYSRYPIDSIVGVHTKESIKKNSLNNKVHIFVGKDTLTIVGCHLSSSNHHISRGYQERVKEADAIYENIKDEHHPIIVMGDMNDISGSYALRRIQEAGMADAWWKGGVGYGATFHDKWLRLRLDHILYQENKLELQFVKVIDSDLSDHNALVAGFTLKKRCDDNTSFNK